MSSHVHLIISTKTGFILENILHDFRRHTAKNIVLAIRENPQESRREWLLKKFLTKDGINFLGTDNHPIEVWSNYVIDQELKYLHNNPVEEGLAFKAEQSVYGNAIDYSGEKGLLDIIVIGERHRQVNTCAGWGSLRKKGKGKNWTLWT